MALRPYVLVLLTTLLGLGGMILIGSFIPEEFTSDAKIVIRRHRLPETSEETKNRWVWVRDGLSISEEILADEFLREVVVKNAVLNKRYGLSNNTTTNIDQAISDIRQQYKISYTGGDANAFEIQTRDTDKSVAKSLAILAIERIEYLYVQEVGQLYEKALQTVSRQLEATIQQRHKAQTAQHTLLDIQIDALQKAHDPLLALVLVHRVETPSLVRVVRSPVEAKHRAWPRLDLLALFGGLAGFCFGLATEFLRRRGDANRAT